MTNDKTNNPVKYRLAPGHPRILVGSDVTVWRQVETTVRERDGYLVVGIRRGRGRCAKTDVLYVHRLMLETFVGPCPEGMICRHMDGNPANDSLDNLRWGTPAENNADQDRHGTRRRGSNHPDARLTEADIPLIVALAAQGISKTEIAIRFGVSRSVIKGIVLGRTWRHVPRDVLAHTGSVG